VPRSTIDAFADRWFATSKTPDRTLSLEMEAGEPALDPECDPGPVQAKATTIAIVCSFSSGIQLASIALTARMWRKVRGAVQPAKKVAIDKRSPLLNFQHNRISRGSLPLASLL
jgi:hypothetical protein